MVVVITITIIASCDLGDSVMNMCCTHLVVPESEWVLHHREVLEAGSSLCRSATHLLHRKTAYPHLTI